MKGIVLRSGKKMEYIEIKKKDFISYTYIQKDNKMLYVLQDDFTFLYRRLMPVDLLEFEYH